MIRPVSWSSSYLLREPFGISTMTVRVPASSIGASLPSGPSPTIPAILAVRKLNRRRRVAGSGGGRFGPSEGADEAGPHARGGRPRHPHPRRPPRGPRGRGLRPSDGRRVRPGLAPLLRPVPGAEPREGDRALRPPRGGARAATPPRVPDGRRRAGHDGLALPGQPAADRAGRPDAARARGGGRRAVTSAHGTRAG